MPKRTLLIPLALVAGLVTASLMLGATEGAFSAVTSNTGNSFQAATEFCPDRNVTADADGTVGDDQPNVNDGTDTAISAASQVGRNRRALVHFTLPTTPTSCTVTSVDLRLVNVDDPPVGRTLHARTVTSPWAENTVTWNNQPTSTSSGLASAPSGGTAVTFDVTSQFATMYSGPNNGFVIVDSAENGLGYEHKFASSEFPILIAVRPTLIINYADAAP